MRFCAPVGLALTVTPIASCSPVSEEWREASDHSETRFSNAADVFDEVRFLRAERSVVDRLGSPDLEKIEGSRKTLTWASGLQSRLANTYTATIEFEFDQNGTVVKSQLRYETVW